MQYRRFGKTELDLPVFSCGGMRFQQSFSDADPVTEESQINLERCVRRALDLGIHHIETARGYGTSEYQLGKILPQLPRDKMIIQTKVEPYAEVAQFKKTFDHSMDLLGLDYVDLFSFHGINNAQRLEEALGCLDMAHQWQREGRIRHIGFSTHGDTETIIQAIRSEAFSYVNLHWFYFQQENWPAIVEARKHDMGVFIISPNDKGGLLYQPTPILEELCAPLHPMTFNALFCLENPEVHTLSCGAARPEDFDLHLETVAKIDEAKALVAPIKQGLDDRQREVLGEDWFLHWREGLPKWQDTPGHMNLEVILRLYGMLKAFDMKAFGEMRYNLLGNAEHWFPGKQVQDVDEAALRESLQASPFADIIPERLQETRTILKGEEIKRLQS